MREFRAAGRAGRPLLARALRADDPHARSHARSLIDALEWDAAMRRLLRYTCRENLDLETGLFRLSHLERPGLDLSPYRLMLDEMATEVRGRVLGITDSLERGRILAHYLGTELGFIGDLDGYIHPDNVFVHRAIDRGKGLPLTLCAIYSFVARRCGLRTGLMPLPGHVMLRLHGRESNLIVDPFHGGEVRSLKGLQDYLAEHGLRCRAVWFRDAPTVQLIHRQTLNLRNALSSMGHYGRARRLAPLIDQLDRSAS